MAMAITMRRVARIFFFATEVTQGTLFRAHYTHIKRPPNSRCVFLSALEDTTKMTAHSKLLASLISRMERTHADEQRGGLIISFKHSQTAKTRPGLADNRKRNSTGLFSPSIMRIFLFGLVSICFALPPEKKICLFKSSCTCPTSDLLQLLVQLQLRVHAPAILQMQAGAWK